MEIIKCPECNGELIKVGETGRQITLGEYKKELHYNKECEVWYDAGVRNEVLYQCPKDKTILIN